MGFVSFLGFCYRFKEDVMNTGARTEKKIGFSHRFILRGILGIVLLLFVQGTQAAIAFRASSSAAIRTPAITYRATGGAVSAASGNITPTLPAIQINDLMICLVEQHDNVVITFPAGWSQIYSISTTATHRASLYYKKAAASEINPLITHTGGNAIIAQCYC